MSSGLRKKYKELKCKSNEETDADELLLYEELYLFDFQKIEGDL